MVLSDRTIERLIADGRIEIDPYDASLLQPSSVDVRVDRYFRVFRNNRYPHIDVKREQEDLTEQVEIDDEPFILHPGEFVLGSTLERVKLPDDLVARLEGKALALDTPLPTPRGWTTMGALRPGDLVFDESGQPTVVVGATRPMLGRPCREVVFSDGTTVVADIAHEWQTIDKSGREHGLRRQRIVTTAEIESTLVVRGERNHQIPLTQPVQYPERDLPIDPYVLGVWLGKSTTTKAEMTCSEPRIVREVVGAGYAVAPRWTRELELSGERVIPGEYLRASVEQRMALLHGLMDADGDVDGSGRCNLTTADETMANRMCELIAGLGFCPTLARRRPRYDVQFVPDRPVVRLQRKLGRQGTCGRFDRHRAIVDVREVTSVPVRCIEVASRRGLFLVTRAFIPTHNSSLGRLGLLIHSTAGFIDPGFDGHVTLELSNVANLPITIYYAMKIGQVSFMELTEPAATPYGAGKLGSKYQGQRGPTPSRYWQNFAEDDASR